MKNSHYLTLLILILLIVALRVAYYNFSKLSDGPETNHNDFGVISGNFSQVGSFKDNLLTSAEDFVAASVNIKQNVISWFDKDLPLCNDTAWCNIEMPKVSYFKFDPPNDPLKWKLAQIQAASGEQVLLKRTVAMFPNYMNFLDGDILFRKYHLPIDIFLDKKRDMSFLKNTFPKLIPPAAGRRLKQDDPFPWETKGLQVIPENYDYLRAGRAPVLKLGYFAFSQEGHSQFFEGPQIGEAQFSLKEFLAQWKEVKDNIKTPFVAVHSSNENWGLLSTFFPDRSENWGQCCNEEGVTKDLMAFLDHPMTLMLMIGQHSNITHPKIVTLPRGLPIMTGHAKRIIWDTMRHLLRSVSKNQLMFTASSSWGPRPRIIKCVASKFPRADFDGRNYSENGSKGRISQFEYYIRLGSARTGLALGGLGTDTFRLWEALTLGTMPVVEKGFGLEKTLWRLPALLVEDFDQVTPELLRTAYVEALYRADDFEFERLTQSFWFSFIAEVSTTMSSQTVLDKFPLQAEDSDFARPFVPFDCWKTNSCGAGTKRVPKSSC